MYASRILLAVAVLVSGPALTIWAQQVQPTTAAAAAQTAAQPAPAPAASNKRPKVDLSQYPPEVQAQAIRDQEWLTAYMMANKGYRLDHMEALEDKFSRMTPTQLETLKMFYEQQHNNMVQQQALFNQERAQQVKMAEMQIGRQQQSLNAINSEESSAATVEDQRLNAMHQEAFEASQDKTYYSTPYGMGSYANPYGGYGGYRGGYGPYRAP